MPNFLVINFDSDEIETYYDFVEAKSEEAATKIAFEVRNEIGDCVWHVATYDAQELRDTARRLGHTPGAKSKAQLRKQLTERSNGQ